MSRRRPTPKPEDYKPFAATFGIALAMLPQLARSRNRSPGARSPLDLSALDVAELSIATFAATHILVKDKVASFIREPFVEGTPADGSARPKAPSDDGGRPGPDVTDIPADARVVLGELLTCTRCAGAWNAAALTSLRILAPDHGRMAMHVLTAVGVNNFLQAGFSALKSTCNLLDARVDDHEPGPAGAEAGTRTAAGQREADRASDPRSQAPA